MTKKKKVLFHSNCSKVLSGFGKNARNILTFLYKTGKYEIVELANGVSYGTEGLGKFPWKAVGTYPYETEHLNLIETNKDFKNKASYGHVMIDRIIEEEKPDVYIGAEDMWAFSGFWEKKWWRQIKTALWVTVDSSPILESCVDAANGTDHFFTWSNFANQELIERGARRAETLHGPVDSSNFFKVKDEKRKKLREQNKIKENEFIIGFVFRNQLRKSVSNLMDGFNKFKKQNPKSNAKLLLHTSWEEGWDILTLMKEKDINKEEVITTYYCKKCKQYEIKPFQSKSKTEIDYIDCPKCGARKSQKTIGVEHGVSEGQLNEIYNTMDVYCHPFTSGGQEIPIQEAKLCELITLVTDYSCGQDCSGEDSGGLPLSWNEYREAGTQFIKASTSPDSISSKLTKVFKMSSHKKDQMGKKARDFVIQNYSIETIGNRLMEIIDEEYEITWDYKIKSLLPDIQFKPTEGLSNEDYIISLYKNMLKINLKKDDEVLDFLLKKLKAGVSRQKITDALVASGKKELEKHKKENEKEALKDYIDFNREEKRLALVLPKSIGDVFMATSLLPDMKKTYPDYDIYFITEPQYFCILEGNKHIHKAIPFTPDCHDALMLEGFSNRKDREDQEGLFDIAILLHVNNQRVLNYTRNGKDRISLDLCT